MSQAQRISGHTARVYTTPPALARASQLAPVAKAAKPRSTPPPPPLAAYRRLPQPRLATGPRLSVPAPAHLSIAPLWDDANLPLRAASQGSDKSIHWIGSTTISLAVGALVAASLMTIRFSDYGQILPQGQTQHATTAERAPAPVELSADVPVQVVESEEPLSIEIELDEVAPANDTVVIPEITVTSHKAKKVTKAAKRAQVVAARKALKRRGRKAQVAAKSAQPDASAEVHAKTAPAATPEPQAQLNETAASAVAFAPAPEAANETVAPEAPIATEISAPPAPALPDKLTREQVKSGLEAQRAKVLACTNGMYGKIFADITISAPGKLTSAVIDGTFAGTKAASCMTKALQKAKFAAFSGADISVRYPFSF